VLTSEHRVPRGEDVNVSPKQMEKSLQQSSERERALTAALAEKEVLLREVRYRVKDNLQIIAHLLRLQHAFAHDPAICEALSVSRNRVVSMALIHERVCLAGDGEVNFSEYVATLARELWHSQNIDAARVRLCVTAEAAQFSGEIATTCAMILNELLTNALKHAFPGERPGVIHVRLMSERDRHWILQVSDDGAGIPLEYDVTTPGTLGMQLVHSLTDQLHGTLILDRTHGTSFTLRFAEPRQPL
jgi:two-component sensor histidine kinase